MWKEMYCFALRINMVLPDWRGFTGLVYMETYPWTDWFETRSTAAHPERDMIQLWSGAQHVFVFVFLRASSLWFVALPLHGCCVLGERVPKMVR